MKINGVFASDFSKISFRSAAPKLTNFGPICSSTKTLTEAVRLIGLSTLIRMRRWNSVRCSQWKVTISSGFGPVKWKLGMRYITFDHVEVHIVLMIAKQFESLS